LFTEFSPDIGLANTLTMDRTQLTMMIAFAATTALLAVLTGVLLAAFDQPRADDHPRTQQWSLMLVIATSVTTAAGVAYALLA
jgi:hypothetical protein